MNGRCKFAEFAGMLSGVAHATAASMACDGSPACVVACSAITLFTIVPEFDQPSAATTPPAPSRVARRCATAVRTSSFAPRYAEKSRGLVTGDEPQPRMLSTATCQPRSAAAAAIERTYVSWLPPPSPDASSSSGRDASNGGGVSTNCEALPPRRRPAAHRP